MHPSSWKGFERRIAKQLGGKRRGPDYGGIEGGKTDIIIEGLAVECKLLSRVSWGDFLGAVVQAEKAAQPGEIPMAIVKKKRAEDRDALVVMRLGTLVQARADKQPDE